MRSRRAASFWHQARKAERGYAAALRHLAWRIAGLVRRYVPFDPGDTGELVDELQEFSRTLRPWAEATAQRMLADVERREYKAWMQTAREMGKGLREELREAPTGAVMRQLQHEQVNLITSVPLDLARRVQDLARDYAAGGRRYDEMIDMIQRTGHVAKSRATLIARTEVAKAQSLLTQARAEYVGSTEYKWVTAHDADVRPSHQRLDGTIQRWDSPPLSDPPNHHAHPGQIWNCRCVSIPILPNV